jgi:hypothetical protein
MLKKIKQKKSLAQTKQPSVLNKTGDLSGVKPHFRRKNYMEINWSVKA